MSDSKFIDALFNSAGSVIASFSVALGLATLSTINGVSHEMVRLQEQLAGIKNELGDIRGDFDKEVKAQNEQIKSLQQRVDRLENKRFQTQSNLKGYDLTSISVRNTPQYSCYVCSENKGCWVTTCSEPS